MIRNGEVVLVTSLLEDLVAALLPFDDESDLLESAYDLLRREARQLRH